MFTCYIEGTWYMCSLSYKTNNNKMPTYPNINPPTLENEKKKTTPKKT